MLVGPRESDPKLLFPMPLELLYPLFPKLLFPKPLLLNPWLLLLPEPPEFWLPLF